MESTYVSIAAFSATRAFSVRDFLCLKKEQNISKRRGSKVKEIHVLGPTSRAIEGWRKNGELDICNASDSHLAYLKITKAGSRDREASLYAIDMK